MINLFQLDASFLMASFVLVVMGCISLAFSLSLYSKSRDIKKLPKNLSVSVFDKTFNVFDPYPSRRKVIHSFIWLGGIFAFVLAFLSAIKIFEMNLLLGVFALFLSLSLLMIEEGFEIHQNAGILIKAVKNRTSLGNGDISALFMVKLILPKLSAYYLLLAAIFYASSMVLPYIISAFLFALANFAGTAFELAVPASSFAPYFPLLLFVVVTVIIQITAGKVKSKLFDFSQSESLVSRYKDFERMRVYVNKLHHHPKPSVSEPEEPLENQKEKV